MADNSQLTNDGLDSELSFSSCSDSDSESSVETVVASFQKTDRSRGSKSLGIEGDKVVPKSDARVRTNSTRPAKQFRPAKGAAQSSVLSMDSFSSTSTVGDSSRTVQGSQRLATASIKTAIGTAVQNISKVSAAPTVTSPTALAVMHMQVSDHSGFGRTKGSGIALQLPSAPIGHQPLRRAQTVASGVHSPGGALRAAGALSIVPSVGSSMSAALAGEEVGRRMLRSEVPDELIDSVEALVDAQCRLHAPHFAQQTIHSLIQSAATRHPGDGGVHVGNTHHHGHGAGHGHQHHHHHHHGAHGGEAAEHHHADHGHHHRAHSLGSASVAHGDGHAHSHRRNSERAHHPSGTANSATVRRGSGASASSEQSGEHTTASRSGSVSPALDAVNGVSVRSSRTPSVREVGSVV